ncbi:MAG: translocation/assembly module TamB domain-containing protein [Rhodoferax sp.]|nr:translocation/assembly module TamB domain-containing protein [Rhodoferax sp.]
MTTWSFTLIKLLRLGLGLLATTIMALLALALVGWLYSARDTSLAFALNQVAHWLPAGQTLQTKDVQGSLREGGHIGSLRWRQGDLSVEATDVTLGWALGPLLQRRLRLHHLAVAQLQIDDQRAPQPDTPWTPPASLQLPIALDIPFTLARLTLTGATDLTASQLSGHYVFDNNQHSLDKGHGQISSGTYELNGSLQAVAPMALSVRLSGRVQTNLPQRKQPLTVTARAQLDGPLASADDTLALQASLRPEHLGGSGATASPAMQAELSARIAPWQSQYLPQANARWQALDLAALWPQAPHTQLSGSASIAPVDAGWRGQIDLRNAQPGAYNRQHLPLTSLTARANYSDRRWAIESLQANAAGGSVRLTGRLQASVWQMDARLQGINPAAIDTRLPVTPVSGTLSARQGSNDIGFDAQLKADRGQTQAVTPALLQGIQASGVWAAPLLTLSTLRIDAPPAQLQGKLGYHTSTRAVQGQLTLALPGATATLDGHLARADGRGSLSVQLNDAAKASAWLRQSVPQLSALRLDGNAEFSASWRGGWQQQGRDLTLDAQLTAAQLGWMQTSAAPARPATRWQLHDLQTKLAGTLAAWQWDTQGAVQIDARDLDWQAHGSGARLSADHWQGRLDQLGLRGRDGVHPGHWAFKADTSADPNDNAPLRLDWINSAQRQTLSVSAGSAQINAPLPGSARIQWQAAQWSRPPPVAATGRAPAATWHSQGQVQGLPLAWLEVISGKPLADLGLRSDLLMDGSWDAQRSDILHLSGVLERSAGDLYLRTGSQPSAGLPALMHEARLQVNLDGQAVSASLRWDSERAGRALAAFSTHLSANDKGWRWDDSAPLGGSLQMQLPPIDAWSMLAPPGWRMRGTLDANASLTGTRAQPHWSGALRADDLALRSVADGIDLQQGTLRARLDGLQLSLEQFTLWGAGGSAGGRLNITGSAQWRPAGDNGTALAQRLLVNLTAQAQALRLSNRADRRLTVSGSLAAQLQDAQLTLTGKLSADQALITLPSETAPTLGSDVVVRGLAPAKANTPSAKAPAQQIRPNVQITLDLGPDFQVRGRGLETRLAGSVELRAQGNTAPTLTGTVRTVRGTYQAYGQRLDIEQGVLRFVGPVDNPALDILAIRPQLTQRVGVQVLGSVLSPVIRLYAEPELPEAEKLAWLVLGRSASGRGGEAALLQQAALALLGNNAGGPSVSLSQALGLDELSIASNTEGTGTATVTLGKRLTQDFYVAYESGLAGTMGVFTIFYDLSRRLTLRARTGEQSALDLVWTLRYD